jgi:hypothetical protein
MLLQRIRKAVAPFHPRGDVLDHVAHEFVVRLLGQRLERLHHGQPGVDHGGQLAGENNQVGQGTLPPLVRPFLDFFLDGNHHQVAVQQRRHGVGFRGGIHRAAELPARPGIPRYVTE